MVVFIPPPIIFHGTGGGGMLPPAMILVCQILGVMTIGFLVYWCVWAWFKNDSWDKTIMRAMSVIILFIGLLITWAVMVSGI